MHNGWQRGKAASGRAGQHSLAFVASGGSSFIYFPSRKTLLPIPHLTNTMVLSASNLKMHLLFTPSQKNAFCLSDESHLSQRQQLMRHSTESFYSNHRALINISIFLKANSFHSNTETEAECDFGRVLLQIFMQSLFCFGFFWTKWDLTWAAPSLCNGFIAIQK